MSIQSIQKQRLAELIDLAQSFRGWNRKQLAEALGRDASNLVPASGVPKLDVVLRLARVLDWPIEQVVGTIRGELPNTSDEDSSDEEDEDLDFDQLHAAAGHAHRQGRYFEMIKLARRGLRVATTPEDRLRAFNREAGGWEGLGQHVRSQEVLHRALRESGRTGEWNLLIRSNLANTHYSLWQLFEGKGVAADLVEFFERNPPRQLGDRLAQATLHYSRGHCLRRLLDQEEQDRGYVATLARGDLLRASQLLLEIADETRLDSYAAIARTCLGGILEAEVASGVRDADSALSEFSGDIDKLIDPSKVVVGDQLEQHGWWCIFACNIALRHLTDPHGREQVLAVFTNKADEIAERLGNWSMRERVVTLDFVRRQAVDDWPDDVEDWMIDDDDVRRITGTMGRFPAFHPVGWQILRRARMLRDIGRKPR